MDNSLIQAVAAADSRGNAGGLDVQVGRLMLTGGAQIDSGTRAGSTGRGGSYGHGERGHRHQRAGQLGRERAVQSYPGAGGWGRLSVATPLLTMDGDS